ncbi:MAG: hypothetical protein IIB53_09495, partial [Planctomycetes bacterium]|nr:hypothetical protein [Planctomycetota bacterium]
MHHQIPYRMVAAIGAIMIILSPVLADPGGDDPYADEWIAYDPGENAAKGYTNPDVVLGSPERFTGELAGFPGVVSIFNSPFGTDEIVSIGEGGFLTLAFDEPITNDPAHRFGVDFIIFGNAFFLDADWPNGRIGDPAILAAEGPLRVSVSSDGVDFTSLGDVMEGLFPTQGYLDSGPYDVTRGNVPSDFTRPVDPALSLEDFAGLTFPQVLDLYQGSGGGIPIDIAASGLEAVRCILIVWFDDGDPNNDNDWSCPENWDEDVVPNNAGADHFAVTISAEEVDLDIAATIDSLALLDGATLNVTCTAVDPDCDDNSDLTITGEVGLRIVGDVVNQLPSTLFVDNNRRITVLVNGAGPEGPVIIGPGGVYRAAAGGARGGITPVLVSGSLEILGGNMSGSVVASGSMTIETNLDLSLTRDIPGSRPPCLAVSDDASVAVGQDFNIIGQIDLRVNSSLPIIVGGDFNNRSLDSTTFSWERGAIVLDGSSGSTQQRFEAAGIDMGALPASTTDNYTMGKITIASKANVVIEDAFDNDDTGQSSCSEAVYVETLVLDAGATLTIDNCRIYYNTLIDNGGTVDFGGC